MTEAELNAACAERLGWRKTPGCELPGIVTPPEWEERPEGPIGRVKFHPLDCFTTATPEWCGLLEKVTVAGGSVAKLEDRFSCIDIESEEIGYGPDIYTAVALAFLEMGEAG